MLYRPRTRSNKAFTMLEITIVTAITAVLVLLLIRWVLGLVAIANDGNERTAVSEAATQLTYQFGQDLSQAQSCSPTGNGPTLAFIDPLPAKGATNNTQYIGIYTTNSTISGVSSSNPALVVWAFTYDNGSGTDGITVTQVQRTEVTTVSGIAAVASGDQCAAVAVASGQVTVKGSSQWSLAIPSTSTIFTGASTPANVSLSNKNLLGVSGIGGTNPGQTGSCNAASGTQTFSQQQIGCLFSGIQLNFILRSQSGIPDTLNSVVTLQTSSSTL